MIRRTIKFRGWSTWTKHMFDPKPVNEPISFRTAYDFTGRTDDPYLILMQYTGLNDRWGREIYEGDILLQRFDFLDTGKPETFHYTVVFDRGCFYADDGTQKLPLDRFEKMLEIVGNIYENPELIPNEANN